MKAQIQELATLLLETGQAHHQAYIETDGFDPDWPFWYADYLSTRLPPPLQARLSKNDLAHLLLHLSQVQPTEAPDESWTTYYARCLIER